MRFIVSFLSYGLIAIFGIVLSAEFSGVKKQKYTIAKLAIFSVAAIFIQWLCWAFLGLTTTTKLYPLITHLPLMLFLIIAFKQPWINAFVSVLSAYLCCQVPRWIAATAFLFSEDRFYRNLLHIAALLVTFALLHFYATKPVNRLLSYSRHSALILGIIPLLYYLFDYCTTVYTNLLYSGNQFSVQFMPSVMATFYFFFLLIYHYRLEKQEDIQRERDLLSLQLHQAETDFSAMRKMQEQTKQYRHDLRHHFALLLELADAGELQKIKNYLRNTEQNLDSFSQKHFCGNDVVNLLLSHFTGIAENAGVKLNVDAVLPAFLPFDDTELCCLLSNGLENAIIAAKQIPDSAKRTVLVGLCIRQKNLLISIQNPYTGNVTIADGLPVTDRKEHGFGTRSMASIVHCHGGQISFLTKDNLFLLRIMLPITD